MPNVTPQDYQDALFSQSAVNLSGIVRSLHDILGRIWQDAHNFGLGTDWVNQHPISRLFAEQIAHLTQAGPCTNMESYHNAYECCIIGAGGEKDEKVKAAVSLLEGLRA
jgi:hypothetical protein